MNTPTLPAVLNDIIWRMAFNEAFAPGFRELLMLIDFRSCVPSCFCNHSAFLEDVNLMELNPFCPGTPYVPLSRVFHHPFSPIRHWIARALSPHVIRTVLRTYPKVLLRSAYNQSMSHWNRTLTRLKRLRPEHIPAGPNQTKLLAIIAQLEEARPLSSACLLYPWPGTPASWRALF